MKCPKKVHVSFSHDIDVSSAETKTVVTCSQMDNNVSDASEEKLVIDDSAMCGTAEVCLLKVTVAMSLLFVVGVKYL